ncbi:hypothetical protein [Sphingobacterium faecale]|uniref:Lipoprotein n=1 Tax=Sphingobacterium faecale TaxID=2803775 RepID=A0ABS1R271_9SPHI|nr:hypothetical protein [Sphingobacterium faecale]MBL1408400.1 hypothetical protein [Sphingobacterium faecale]
MILQGRLPKMTGIVLTLLLLNSCASYNYSSFSSQLRHSNCNQQNVYNYHASDLPIPLHQLKIDTILSSKISKKSLNIANAIGILDQLTQYTHAKNSVKTASVEHKLDMMSLRLDIFQKINNASLIVSAVSSELDCEEERTSQIANFLEGKQSDLESKLTISAIVIGASGAIATGGTISNERVSNTIGIGTGIAEASIGLFMLFNKRKIEFYHERNALRDVWFGSETSTNFPPFIWYYLNYADPNEADTKSVRKQIIEKWKNFGQIDEEDEELVLDKLYFGKGGRYKAEELNNRADMYDQVESHINLLKQELMALSLEIEKI